MLQSYHPCKQPFRKKKESLYFVSFWAIVILNSKQQCSPRDTWICVNFWLSCDWEGHMTGLQWLGTRVAKYPAILIRNSHEEGYPIQYDSSIPNEKNWQSIKEGTCPPEAGVAVTAIINKRSIFGKGLRIFSPATKTYQEMLYQAKHAISGTNSGNSYIL